MQGISDLTSIIVSQDGDNASIQQVVQTFRQRVAQEHPNVKFHHVQKPHTLVENSPTRETTAFIAQHYKFALDKAFLELDHDYVITLEDDIVFSPDFLSFFDQTTPLMEKDATIWCVSSWNDFGYGHLVKDNKRLYRTHFFPGLGWLTSKTIWQEVTVNFAMDQWDYWMRSSLVHKWRGILLSDLITFVVDCIYPEVPRNHNIGKEGATVNPQVFEAFLNSIAYNREANVSLGNLDYLLSSVC